MDLTNKKCLIAYFSRNGQNYVSGRIVDLKVGNTEVVANMIQKITGGDMFHIEPVTTYPKDYTAVMLLGLFMNASVTRAFTTSGWAFVFPLLLIQLGRTVWTLVNSASVVLREHYIRALIWVIATTPLWIAGAADNAEARLLWLALAAGIDQIGRWLAHPIPGWRLRSENVAFDAVRVSRPSQY